MLSQMTFKTRSIHQNPTPNPSLTPIPTLVKIPVFIELIIELIINRINKLLLLIIINDNN